VEIGGKLFGADPRVGVPQAPCPLGVTSTRLNPKHSHFLGEGYERIWISSQSDHVSVMSRQISPLWGQCNLEYVSVLPSVGHGCGGRNDGLRRRHDLAE